MMKLTAYSTPVDDALRAMSPEDRLRQYGEGLNHYQRTPAEELAYQEDMRNAMLPDVTELGEPVAGAMFSDRYVDVEHMPREIVGTVEDLEASEWGRPLDPWWLVRVAIAGVLIIIALVFAIHLGLPLPR